MADADGKHIGKGSKGKGDAGGAMTQMPDEALPAGGILKNRDKQQHTKERGKDGKHIQTEQYQDHAANRRR